jgi:hypothetical protein
MLFRISSLLLSLLLLAGFRSQLAAQDTPEEKEYRNSVELFLGFVTETDDNATGPGIGIEYQRHLSDRWSVGIEAIELSTNDVSRDFVVVAPAYFRPVAALWVKAGVGLEASKSKPEDGSDSETETQFLVRFGAAWEFELGHRFTLSPEANLDVVGGEVSLVYGVSLGLGF